MEVSALRYSGGIRLHGASPLLRLQSDDRLIALMRRGNTSAFEVLVSRYHSRLLAFCRHLLGSKEDAEDVLQEVLAAAFNAILADQRPINVRPWLYRIARNRSLNHLRRIQAIGVDSMDIHFAEYGATTADKVHDREQFRLLVRDIQTLPETQRTALVLREMDALSYDQIAEAMETTVPGVKSLLVRARISLAEAAEARQLSCDEVRIELAEVAEGLHKRPPAIVRRHIRACTRCASFQGQLKQTNKVLAALLPVGPLALLRKALILHIGHSAGTGSGATATASATSATVASTAGGGAAFGSAGGLVSAGALATKAAAGLAAAAIVTAGAVEVTHVTPKTHRPPVAPAIPPSSGGASVASAPATQAPADALRAAVSTKPPAKATKATAAAKPATTTTTTTTTTAQHPSTDTTATQTKTTSTQPQTQTDPTVLSGGSTTSGGSGQATDSSTGSGSSSSTSTSSSSGSDCSSGSGTSQSTDSSGGTTTTTTTTTSTTPSSTTTTPQTSTDPSSAPPTGSTSTTDTTTTPPSCPSPQPASTPGS